MAYATVEDIADRMMRSLSSKEETVCQTLLEDVAVLIDSINSEASEKVKEIVSCRAVARMIGNGDSVGVPVGASQGSMSALGYAQSWTMGNGGAVGEIYLSKVEKQMLGAGNRIGSYSPVEELCTEVES